MRTKNGPLRKSSCSAEAFGSRGFSTKLCASGDGGDLSANQIGRPDMGWPALSIYLPNGCASTRCSGYPRDNSSYDGVRHGRPHK
jgi:hypothetical protein